MVALIEAYHSSSGQYPGILPSAIGRKPFIKMVS
jgi:hypothetical protein